MNTAALADSKPHYYLLDALRGVAALLVLWYHVHEGFAFAQGAPLIATLNHGYLAVDFFFMLSGFVIGYAYDDRWRSTLTVGVFVRRRLARLHPMVVFGALAGAVCFLLQGCVRWDGTEVPYGFVALSFLMALLMMPVMPGASAEVRGNGEAFPLNGPAWSLFFEYIGNILYALVMRRFSTATLAAVTAALGCLLGWYTCTDAGGDGCLSVGWTLGSHGFCGGLLRMLFPFSAGMLMSRIFRPMKIRGAFWICAVILLGVFAVPYIPSEGAFSFNGLYEIVCIACVFPLVVWAGASGGSAVDTGRADSRSGRVFRLLGDISYPLYITHYPVMYLFYAWLIDNKLYTLGETWPVAVGVCILNIALAWFALKYYDAPLRSRLRGVSARRGERRMNDVTQA